MSESPFWKRFVDKQEQQQVQFAQMDNQITYNEALIDERDQGIAEISQQIGEVNEIFQASCPFQCPHIRCVCAWPCAKLRLMVNCQLAVLQAVRRFMDTELCIPPCDIRYPLIGHCAAVPVQDMHSMC